MIRRITERRAVDENTLDAWMAGRIRYFGARVEAAGLRRSHRAL